MKKITAISRWGVLLGALLCPLTSNALVIENALNPGAVTIDFFEPIGQSFTAEFADLTSIAFYYTTLNPGEANDPFTMFLYEGAGLGGTQLGSVNFSLPYTPPGSATYGYFDVNFSAIDLVVGNVYTAGVTTNGTSSLWATAFSGNNYAGGQLYSANPQGFCGNGATCDLTFRVTGAAAVVPEPSTLPLLSLGFAALGFSLSKRKTLR
jgi:hypothetical protein